MTLGGRVKKIFSVLILLLIGALVIVDSDYHFDKERVSVKRQHQSAQRNWSVFQAQRYTYLDSSFRYTADMAAIGLLIEPGSLVLSDLTTSYYLAAELPVAVVNIHRHHGIDVTWRTIISRQSFCNMNDKRALDRVTRFIKRQHKRSAKRSEPKFSYVVLNRDHKNFNMRLDCLSAKRGVAASMGLIADLVYSGEHLRLYKIRS